MKIQEESKVLNNKLKELSEEQLEKVNGGGTCNGVTFFKGQVYAPPTVDISAMDFDVFILKNCGPTTCDLDLFHYYKSTGDFIFICHFDTNYKYSDILKLKFIRIEDIYYISPYN